MPKFSITKTMVFEYHVSKRLRFTMKNWPTFQKHFKLQWKIGHFSKTLCFTMKNECFRGTKNIVKRNTFKMCGLRTIYFTMNFKDLENQVWKLSQFDWFSNQLKHCKLLLIFWSNNQFLLTVFHKNDWWNYQIENKNARSAYDCFPRLHVLAGPLIVNAPFAAIYSTWCVVAPKTPRKN